MLGFSSVLLLSGVLYVAAYWSLPNDGTVLDVVMRPAQPGLAISSVRADSALHTGDVVLGVEGQPLDAWLSRSLQQPGPAAPVDALTYTVLRGGQTLTVRQPLLPPTMAGLVQNATIFFFLFYLQAVGLFVFARRPHLLSARMLLVLSSCLFASSLIYFTGLPLSGLRHGWLAWLWLWGIIGVYGLVAGSGTFFTLVFPRPWPRLRRPALWAAAVYLAVWVPVAVHVALGWGAATGTSARLLLVVRASSTMAVLVFPLTVFNSVMTYRQLNNAAEQRQIRWVIWSLLTAILPWVLLAALPQSLGLPTVLPPLVIGLLWCTLPTAFAISILREGLFDIDVIINRSLVYGGLTLLLALAYFAGVVLLQGLFQTLTGERQSQLATVLSTLAIAALFSPLRARLQQAVDRRFFRRKYDAARTLAAFGATLRDEVDLSVLTQRLEGAVHETMEPAHIWLWLRPPRARVDEAGLPARWRQ